MPYKKFDVSKINLLPLLDRESDLEVETTTKPLDAEVPAFESEELDALTDAIVEAKKKGAPVIMLMGGHVLRRGNANYIIDLMRRGVIDHLGMNGSVSIHDYEFSKIGRTSESVAKYISEGQFGLWKETGEINDIVNAAMDTEMGYGEAVGKHVWENNYPHRETSLLANAYRYGVPATVHVGIGQDIIHEHPNVNGAALGECSYRDFLILTESISKLENGVFLNYGTAVMGPEVYLKALAMARNVAHQEGKVIQHFTTAVLDLTNIGRSTDKEAAKMTQAYYFRPYKTVLVRTVSDGGKSYYVRGDHAETFPNLYHQVLQKMEK